MAVMLHFQEWYTSQFFHIDWLFVCDLKNVSTHKMMVLLYTISFAPKYYSWCINHTYIFMLSFVVFLFLLMVHINTEVKFWSPEADTRFISVSTTIFFLLRKFHNFHGRFNEDEGLVEWIKYLPFGYCASKLGINIWEYSDVQK